MQIIRNFIKNQKVLNELTALLSGCDFPWYYSNVVGDKKDTKDFYFFHHLYENNKQLSPFFNQVASPILGRLNYNYLLRARTNLYTLHSEHIPSTWHTDDKEPHTVALFYLNTCNGYTIFKDGTKIKSEANKIVIFNGNTYHSSVTQTDTKRRIVINFNLT
tara:strand:+ start:41 stop:523 length:483 start_codon:yes stop_codon:yes gene_type:complete